MAVSGKGALRLCEQSDFRQHIEDAGRHFAHRGIPPEYIEKDYYITECLRIVSAELGDAAVFKGGTSLSKGWALVDRFSEDVDLFIDPLAFDPPRGGKAMRTTMKRLSERVVCDLPVLLRGSSLRATRGIARSERFEYASVFPRPSPIAREVWLASGVGSGREPVSAVAIQSLVGEYLQASGASIVASDIGPFTMRLLHFRRTFVEKLFAVDHAVTVARATGLQVGARMRHYFDLCALGSRPEVLEMLRGPEYRAIVRDCIEIDRRFYRRAARDPDEWSFRASAALFPEARLSAALEAQYEQQCSVLCFRGYPPWCEVLARFEALREWL
jgi:hypothetical protein